MAMPVAFRPEPSDRLQRVTRDNVQILESYSMFVLGQQTILLNRFNVFIFVTCVKEQIVNHQKIKQNNEKMETVLKQMLFVQKFLIINYYLS